jgi:hypothetical protein
MNEKPYRYCSIPSPTRLAPKRKNKKSLFMRCRISSSPFRLFLILFDVAGRRDNLFSILFNRAVMISKYREMTFGDWEMTFRD